MNQTGWCPDNAICMDWIERRVVECLEHFIDADTVYMSEDIYVEFMKLMAQSQRHHSYAQANGYYIIRIITSAGELTVKKVPHVTNFCYVGTETSHQRLVWEKVDQEFEKAVLEDS